jgi:redox-sensitive bicupin YhaK (pirin superfamily)
MLIEATHVSGKPLVEPAARYGPIIMNTQGQIRQTFEELAKRKLLKAS